MDLTIDCKIQNGQFVSIYGVSGSGKTTILRILAGLLTPEYGYIKINDELWLDTKNKINLKPQKRKIGYVSQEYTLFPNMTVKENLSYALEKKQDSSIINELIDVIDLEKLKNRKPDTLSGGQRQRIALARALVRRPKLLLLDEPLSSIDESMRFKLQDFILKVHNKYKLTTLLVSHDIGEVFKMSDKIITLENGKIKKEGSPEEIFFNDRLSGKFRFTGTILSIKPNEVIDIISVLIGNEVIKVTTTKDDNDQFNIGDKVIIVSKAFNPMIIKINI